MWDLRSKIVMAYGEVEVLLLIFLTSALNGDELLASRSGRLVLS